MRPLTEAPPRDKIVQEVIRMILEVIFLNPLSLQIAMVSAPNGAVTLPLGR